jgi:hypothetical protein
MEWLFGLVLAAATIVPMWRLCDRDGIAPLWSLVSLFPPGLLVLLWVLAFRRPERLV